MSSETPPKSSSKPDTPTIKETTTTAAAIPNGQPKESKGKRPEAKTVTTAENIAEAGAGVKLTGAQLKKQKAAEKAARRAATVADRGAQAQSQTPPAGQQQGPVEARENAERQRRMSTANRESGGGEGQHHRRTPSTTVRLPVRGAQQSSQQQNSQPQQQQQQQQQHQYQASERTTSQRDKVMDKRVPMLGHLYPSSSIRKASLTTADRQIHPAVLALGLQMRDYVICGSNARTVATLLVFKKVIQSYDTPSGVALSRDLTRHLSHQINYLISARPLSIAQGNSIRWIKKLITALDPDLADTEAKAFLCRAIDTFIREKITLADEVIATQALNRIKDEGEVILTYGKSSVVEKTLLAAFEAGKNFKVIVVDSRPLFEGKNLARSLLRAGLKSVQYGLLSSLADIVEQEGVTKCFLGASAMLGNGTMRSRAGSAMVAMMAKECCGGAYGVGKIPVIVLCESIKFTARVALDSLTMNEVADADMLVEHEDSEILIDPSAQTQGSAKQEAQQQQKKGGKGGGGSGSGSNNNNNNANPDNEKSDRDPRGLDGWRDKQNLYLVNLMYDVTPTEYLDLVVSELGSLPPSAVPVVNGVHGGDE